MQAYIQHSPVNRGHLLYATANTSTIRQEFKTPSGLIVEQVGLPITDLDAVEATLNSLLST